MDRNDAGPSVSARESVRDDEHFMDIAVAVSQRSKDPMCKVGACIVNNEKKIVGIGYNAMPGYRDERFSYEKNKENKLEDKLTYVCHAELNAIVNKMCCNIKGCTMYVTRYPCNECAKLIVQSGIKSVVYKTDPAKEKWESKASKIMFVKTDVQFRYARCLHYICNMFRTDYNSSFLQIHKPSFMVLW